MTKKHKLALFDKILLLTLKAKSFAFMKIFLQQAHSLKNIQRIRHYDLQIEGAASIAGFLKKKMLQTFIRTFYEIKNCYRKPPKKSSLRQQNKITRSDANLRLSKYRIKPQTDRNFIQSKTYGQFQIQPLKFNSPRKRSYKSDYAPSELSSTRSNLEVLLEKVKKVNNQSKNQSQIKYIDATQRSSAGFSRYQMTKKRVSIGQQICDLPLCTYPSRSNGINPYAMGKNQQQNQERVFQEKKSYLNMEYSPMSKNVSNVTTLKKRHRHEKRSIIMNKILQLQSSLFKQKQNESYREYFMNSNISQPHSPFRQSTTSRSRIDPFSRSEIRFLPRKY